MRNFIILIFSVFIFACSDNELADMHRISNGAKLYKMNCANCHQENGEGLAKLMPPLLKSDWFEKNIEELPCLIKVGNKGPITVNGLVYTQPMPGFGHLSDSEIKDVSVFVAQKFGNLTWEQADSLFSRPINSCN